MRNMTFSRFGSSLQTHWDWRAAANFICGGAGSGLLTLAILLAYPDPPSAALLVVAVGLILVGLICVWAEIGRPFRALNVIFHPQTSWMTREAFVAGLIVITVVPYLMFGTLSLAWVGGIAGLLFLFCQGMILRAAKGIPAWREPSIVSLIVSTGLAEGISLVALIAAFQGKPVAALVSAIMVIVALRAVVWSNYQSRLVAAEVPLVTQTVLTGVRRVLLGVGTVLPLVAGAVAMAVPGLALLATLVAALATLAAGAYMKLMIVTRAAQNQGYALTKSLRRGHPLKKA